MDFDMVHSYDMSLASLASSHDSQESLISLMSQSSTYPSDDRRRNGLCLRLLDIVKESVLTFKPSQSLAILDVESPSRRPAVEIDVVISGGGLKGYFMAGCYHILQNEMVAQNVKIARISGASAGAWCALFMLTGVDTDIWIETYHLCRARPHMTMHEVYEEIWPWMSKKLPENAWEICSGRLFISITEVTMFGFKNHVISEFTSNQDLFEACLASSTVPYLSLPQFLRCYRGMWVIDGGVTNNTPIFPDNVRRQLIFRLTDVFYPLRWFVSPKDLCIESLVVRGAILMSRFLQGEESDSFSWLNPSLPTFQQSVSDDKGKEKPTHISKESRKRAWGSMLAVGTTALLIVGVGLFYIRKDYLDTRRSILAHQMASFSFMSVSK